MRLQLFFASHTVATLRCRVTLTRIRVSLAVVTDAQIVNTSRPSLLFCHTGIVRFAVAVVGVVGGDCGALVVRSSFDAVPLAPSFCQSVSGCDACLGLSTCAVRRVGPLSPAAGTASRCCSCPGRQLPWVVARPVWPLSAGSWPGCLAIVFRTGRRGGNWEDCSR